MKIVLLGAPGSGKGTQGARLSQQFGIPKIATGDALRAAVAQGTELGKAAKAAMEAGQLVADEIVIGIVRARLLEPDTAAGFILDGFPRNVAQARILDDLLADAGRGAIDLVLHLKVEEDEILKRLLARAGIEGRADDNEATIRQRIAVYQAETRPLLDYYETQGKLLGFAGTGNVDVIFDCLVEAIGFAQT